MFKWKTNWIILKMKVTIMKSTMKDYNDYLK